MADIPWVSRILLLFKLNAVIDAENSEIPITKMNEAILNRKVYDLLKGLSSHIDSQVLRHWDLFEEEWLQLENVFDPQKVQVGNNGICLLISYVIEGLQQSLSTGHVASQPFGG